MKILNKICLRYVHELLTKEPCSKDPVSKFVRYAQRQPKLTDSSKDAI